MDVQAASSVSRQRKSIARRAPDVGLESSDRLALGEETPSWLRTAESETKRKMLRGPGLTLRLSLMLAAVFAMVFAAGCSASGQSAPTVSPTIQDAPTATTSAQTGREVTQAQIISNLPADFPIVPYVTDGVLPEGTSTLAALLAQGKPVILNFWAGNCPPCRAEMPGLQKMYDQLKSQVVLVGVDVGPFFGLGTHQQAKQLLQQLNITYPTGDTSDTSIVPKFKVAGLPSTYFLRPDGTVMKSWTGLIGESDAVHLAQNLISSSASG